MSHQPAASDKQVSESQHSALDHSGFDADEVGQMMTAPPFQLKAGTAELPAGTGAGADGLGSDLINGFAVSTGHDLSEVKVHRNSSEPAKVGAHAYAQGNDIHVGPGQEKHLAHEAGHIVQQREGKVKANAEVNGRPVNDEPALEGEADRMGEKAVQMQKMATSDGAGPVTKGRSSTMQMKSAGDTEVIQRVESYWGKFHPNISKTNSGLNAELEFEPGDQVDATKIAFSQAVRTSINHIPRVIDPSQKDRMVNDESEAEGFRIDRLTTRDNPLYGTPSLGASRGLNDTTGSNSKFDLGYHYDDSGTIKKKNAFMHDSPGHAAVHNSKMEFESAVLAIEGAQKDTFYGSIKWGWERDGSGILKELPTELGSMGTPSNNFLAAGDAWNKTTARGTVATKNDDTVAYKWSAGSFAEDFQVLAGTKVRRIHSVATEAGEYQMSRILNGPNAGTESYFHVDDLEDLGDGAATIDLPVQDVHVTQAEVTLNDDLYGPFRYVTTLPLGTRVQVTDRTFEHQPFSPDFPYAAKVEVEVIDGPYTGHSGYVPVAVLQDENTNVG
ncbi:MAG: DUF4157 domain-containing protein [Bacteroidota bacterium]